MTDGAAGEGCQKRQQHIDGESGKDAIEKGALPLFLRDGAENGDGEIDAEDDNEEVVYADIPTVDDGVENGNRVQIDAAAAVAPNDEEKPDNAPEKERDDGLAHALFEVFLRGAAFPIVHERRAGQHDEYGNGKIKKALHKIVGDPAGRFAEIPKGTPVQEHDAEAGIDIQHRDIGLFRGHTFLSFNKYIQLYRVWRRLSSKRSARKSRDFCRGFLRTLFCGVLFLFAIGEGSRNACTGDKE